MLSPVLKLAEEFLAVAGRRQFYLEIDSGLPLVKVKMLVKTIGSLQGPRDLLTFTLVARPVWPSLLMS